MLEIEEINVWTRYCAILYLVRFILISSVNDLTLRLLLFSYIQIWGLEIYKIWSSIVGWRGSRMHLIFCQMNCEIYKWELSGKYIGTSNVK